MVSRKHVIAQMYIAFDPARLNSLPLAGRAGVGVGPKGAPITPERC
jgi:hypothetical protein